MLTSTFRVLTLSTMAGINDASVATTFATKRVVTVPVKYALRMIE
jgi:hypothetical protein